MSNPIKALSVHQPWAMLISTGTKTLEIRSWKTNYQGPLVICSTKSLSKHPDAEMYSPHVRGEGLFPRGVTLCLVNLINCRRARHHDRLDARLPSLQYAEKTELGWTWQLELVRKLPRVQVKGAQGLWNLPPAVAELCGLTGLSYE